MLLCPKAHDFRARETFMGKTLWLTYGADKVLCPADKVLCPIGKGENPRNPENIRKPRTSSD